MINITEATRALRIGSRHLCADGVVTLTLEDPTGTPLPVWSPGAHVDLHLGPDGGPGLVRQYSLCGDPADHDRWQVAVLRDPGTRGGSAYVHDTLREGDVVQVQGPRNHFPLEDAERYVFIAGGIGITPVVPMIRAARAAGIPWELHYGGRTRASLAFAEQLMNTAGGRAELYPQDEVGHLPLADILADARSDTLVYCCGPGPLLDAVEAHCSAGWPTGSLHVERFSPKTLDLTGQDTAFEVELASSGLVLVVPPDCSILTAVEAAGVDVPSSCHEGTCGTCETALLGGEGDHRDSLLSASEQAANESIFICVSRARSPRLVLDL